MTTTTIIQTFPMKAGDLLPSLTYDLRYENPDADLAAAIGINTAVTFSMMRRPTGDDMTAVPVIIAAPAVVEAAFVGVVRVRYDWKAGDTDVPGAYWGEFQFSISDEAPTIALSSVIQSYPFISDSRRGDMLQLLAISEAEWIAENGYTSASPLSLPLSAPTRGYIPIDIASDLA